MSTIFCIIDGMTDPDFSSADYPALSCMQLSDYIKTTPDGYDTQTVNCVLTLLGIRGFPHNLRGYAEALGMGLPIRPDELIMRVSWYSVHDGVCTLPVDAPAGVRVGGAGRCYPMGSYKSLIVLSGCADRLEAVRTVPPYGCAGRRAEAFRPGGCSALEDFFDRNLTKSVCAIPWGQSRAVALPRFDGDAAVVCGIGLMRGIAKLLDMTPVTPKNATGDTDTNLAEKTEAALNAAQRHAFVLLHINGADEAAHRKDAKAKAQFLHRIDREVLPGLLGSAHSVYVTSDHGTSPLSGQHINAPQPLFIRHEP